jgi:hypothetical protein
MPSSEMLCRVARVGTDVSEKRFASINRVTRFGELGWLAVTSNRSTHILMFPASRIFDGAIRYTETSVLTRTTWRNISDDGILQSYRLENLNLTLRLPCSRSWDLNVRDSSNSHKRIEPVWRRLQKPRCHNITVYRHVSPPPVVELETPFMNMYTSEIEKQLCHWPREDLKERVTAGEDHRNFNRSIMIRLWYRSLCNHLKSTESYIQHTTRIKIHILEISLNIQNHCCWKFKACDTPLSTKVDTKFRRQVAVAQSV